MAAACVETMLPIWQAPLDLQEALIEVWQTSRKESKETSDVTGWEQQIGKR